MNSLNWIAVGISLGAGAILVLINGFFVFAELSLVKIREGQLQALAARGNRTAKIALFLKQSIGSVIAATQVGITLTTLGIGKTIEPLAEKLANPILERVGLGGIPWILHTAEIFAFILTTFALIIFGEVVPKAIAVNRTLEVALAVSHPMRWCLWLARPFTWLIESSAAIVLRQLGLGGDDNEGPHSEDELRLMFLKSQRPQSSADLGRNIVLNSLDLRRRIVWDIMRPRRDVTALDTGASLAECLEIAERTRYSRFPLCEEGNLDRALGVVHFKDLVAQRNTAQTGADLRTVMRPLIYVPSTCKLEKLLGLFLERKSHFAMVVDEYGGTEGIVTLENCLEELVGQIQDEHDQEKPRIHVRDAGHWEFDGQLPLFEVSELLGVDIDGGDNVTIGGWIVQQLGSFPRRGVSLPVPGGELKVLEVDGLRVARVELRRHPENQNAGDPSITGV